MGKEQFSNTVKAEWYEARDMMLIEDVSFINSRGVLWRADVGSIINGASIPKILWPIFGSPYVGHYRRAAVLHDVYYAKKGTPRIMVDRMFKEAMIADGVPKFKAKIMYLAVRRFGRY